MSTLERGRIIVVGASMGGLRAAEQLRSAGWKGELVVIGEEPHKPYNRPPLTKEILARPGTPEESLESTALRQRASVSDAQWRLGERVIASDLHARTVTVDTGEHLEYDGLVIATGIRPRHLQAPGPTKGRYIVRTLEESRALHEELSSGKRVLVVGAGFIGCEVASTARQLGCAVQLVEGSRGPMHRVLGQEVSEAMRNWLTGQGIEMVSGSYVEEFLTGSSPDDHASHARAAGVRLADGQELAVDVVVEAVGSVPNTEWLEGNGLDLTDGVVVDSRMRVEGAPRTVAVGDVARFPDPWSGGELRRIEHWQTAIDTAKTAAKSLVASLGGTEEPAPFSAMPSFWSDQFGVRIQGVGAPHRATSIEVLEGSLGDPASGVAISYQREGETIAVVNVGLPAGRLVQYRAMLTKITSAA